MDKEVFSKLLRPIAGFCIRRSIKLQGFMGAFKEVLLEAATQDLERRGQEINGSKLSVMTGIHRKDIKKFLEGTREEGSKNIITRVIGQWLQDPLYQTKTAKPRVLSVEGADSEFAGLVESVSVDLNPYTVLFELERINAVERTPRGLKLKVDFYYPDNDLEAAYGLLSNDLNDFIKSVEENIHGPEAIKHLHLKTEYDRIPVALIPKVKEWLLEEGSKFHNKVRQYVSKFDADLNKTYCEDEQYGKISLGTFSYSSNEDKN